EDRSRLRLYEDVEKLQEQCDKLQQALKESQTFIQKLEEEIEGLEEDLRHKQEALDAQAELAIPPAPNPEPSPQPPVQDPNPQIHLLLAKIELLKGVEQRYLDVLKENEHLHQQLRDQQKGSADQDQQTRLIRQQYALSKELQERLDQVYGEFNALQDKIQSVETHLLQPHQRQFDVAELQGAFQQVSADLQDLKLKNLSTLEENQRLTRLLTDADDQLQSAHLHRQQLLSKVAYLEKLITDLQKVAEHNKKLETQLRRIAQIQSHLSGLSSPGPAEG
ncbi:MAG: hypothetical protein ACKO6K_07455, partial [Chitinophagaceae bacterium]